MAYDTMTFIAWASEVKIEEYNLVLNTAICKTLMACLIKSLTSTISAEC